MKSLLHPRRAVATLMLGVFATMLLAPVAEAGNGRGNHRRWKRHPVVREVRYVQPAPRAHYVHRHSDAGPILAGIVGGIVLGAAIANAQPAVHASYSYWDPYCEVRYSTLDRYRTHIRSCDHPRVVRVMDRRSGHHVRDLCWREDAWREYHGDWRHGDDYGTRYKDDRYRDDDREWDDD